MTVVSGEEKGEAMKKFKYKIICDTDPKIWTEKFLVVGNLKPFGYILVSNGDEDEMVIPKMTVIIPMVMMELFRTELPLAVNRLPNRFRKQLISMLPATVGIPPTVS